jgi:predicted component of type VI protein secretion system
VNIIVFKTDKTEAPAEHYGQMAHYREAAAALWQKPVRVFLYYLRSGAAFELS